MAVTEFSTNVIPFPIKPVKAAPPIERTPALALAVALFATADSSHRLRASQALIALHEREPTDATRDALLMTSLGCLLAENFGAGRQRS